MIQPYSTTSILYVVIVSLTNNKEETLFSRCVSIYRLVKVLKEKEKFKTPFNNHHDF